MTETGNDSLVIWSRAAPAGPPFAQFPGLAASDSGLFIGYDNTIIAVGARDGGARWQRSELPAHALVAFGDSVVALLGGGLSVGLRQATMQLADTAGAAVWAIAASGDTAVVFLQIATEVGETGDFVVARVHVPSATVLSRRRMPRLENEFAENRRMVVQDSVVVLPISGCAVAVDARTAQRLWRQCLNIAQVSLRDGVMIASSGGGEMVMMDPHSGRIERRLDMRVSSPFDQFPCREGIMFVNSALQVVQNHDGARPRAIAGSTPDDLYVRLVRTGTVLYAHSERFVTALRCN